MDDKLFTKEEVDHVLYLKDQELAEKLKDASQELAYLQCGKCDTKFEADGGKDYGSGVICPACRGGMLVGVCQLHRIRVRITQSDWDNLNELTDYLAGALAGLTSMPEIRELWDGSQVSGDHPCRMAMESLHDYRHYKKTGEFGADSITATRPLDDESGEGYVGYDDPANRR